MPAGAAYVAVCAALGNALQGWDNALIAGTLLYIVPEFHLESQPSTQGTIVSASLIGAVVSTFIAGPAADWIGRRKLLLTAAICFAAGAAVELWSPTVRILVVGRTLDGFSVGLISTIAPLFIAECAPPETRGQLATLPQLMGIVGMVVAYIIVFFFSLTAQPNWRLMFGVSLAPAVIYLLLVIFFLPESPRWLVSKGKIREAKEVLMALRGTTDVTGELALLVEGLGVGLDGTLEEWLLKPTEVGAQEDEEEPHVESGQVKLFGPDDGFVWIAQPIGKGVHEEGGEGEVLHQGSYLGMSRSSSIQQGSSQIVSIMDGIQNKKEGTDIGDAAPDGLASEPAWDQDGVQGKEDIEGAYLPVDLDNEVEVGSQDLRKHLLAFSPYFSRQSSTRGGPAAPSQSSTATSRQLAGLLRGLNLPSTSVGASSLKDHQSTQSFPDSVSAASVGGGWQLAWQLGEGGEGPAPSPAGTQPPSPRHEDGYRRVFMLQEGTDIGQLASTLAMPGISAAGEQETFQAAVLLSNHPPQDREFLPEDLAGPAMVHPSKTATVGPAWKEMLNPGVTQALIVGISLQSLQQLCGINAVLYYTPAILTESGGSLLASLGLSTDSSSILASMVTTMLMLPTIFAAMWLMDRAGRRQLLLRTIPVMIASLALLTIAYTVLSPGSVLQSAGSLLGLICFSCSFVMGFGPVPNIICSEIFPTRVRGACIGLCALCMWGFNIAVSDAFPVLKSYLGLGGVFAIFGAMSIISWVFIWLRVPETKGLPLEVISEIFAMSAHAEAAASHSDAELKPGDI